MVVLGCADGLFAGSSAVLVVAVVVSSEMQELVTANQVVIAVVFSVFAVQQGFLLTNRSRLSYW